ncbi:chalcone isomerase family protein [Pseudodesulfovibrio sp.]|nr:chalcone isomerase family protein [Pseudodesulfovibrio sp.]
MRLRFLIVLLACLLLLPITTHAGTGVVARYVPKGEAVGKGRLSFLFWDVYDATLYAPEAMWQPTAPYALSIAYLRALKGEAIAKRSIEEIQKLGFTDDAKTEEWYQTMERIFPDVDEGFILTGVRDETGRTLFYKQDIRIGIIDDPEFADWFFGIWLDENTSEPKLRNQLLGIPGK